MTDPDSRLLRLGRTLDRLLDTDPAQRDALLAELPPSLRLPIEAALAQSGVPGAIDELASHAAARFETPPESLIGRSIGGFETTALLGVGGTSWVYAAQRVQGGAIQQVALKRLRPDLVSESLRRRFSAEQRIVARLQHPGIARLIAAGVDEDSVPWLATELVEGKPLLRWCDERRLSLPQRLRLFVKVCEAVAAAHRQLIVHRDLKPGNVLIGADGQPKLLDFGISRLLDDDTGPGERTRAEWRLLTPEYAAPEQLDGAAPDIAMDVYALGVMLYELLCGSRPPSAVRRRHDRRIPPPSQTTNAEAAAARGLETATLRRRLRGDLDAIALHALQFDPEQRYPRVEVLADDLRAVLGTRPISLRRRHLFHPTWRFVQRNWPACALAALAALATGVGAFGVLRESQQRQQALERAVATERFLLGLFGSDIVSGEEAAARTVLDVLDEGARQARGVRAERPELAARLLVTIASVQDQLDLHGAALANLAEAEAAAQDAGDALLLARARLGQANVLAENHESPERIGALLETALPALRAHATDPAELADGLSLAANALTELPESDEARTEALYREALAALRHGAIEPEKAAEVFTNLGGFYLLAGRMDRSIEAQRAAYALALKHLGAERILTHRIGFGLGQALFRSGEWNEAQRLFIHSGKALERMLPPDHRDHIAFYSDRARLAARIGRMDEADGYWNQALAVARRGGDELRTETARVLASMGVMHKLRGDTEAALRDLEAARKLYLEAGTTATAGACNSLGLLARIRIEAGRLDDGLALLDEAPASCRTPFIEEARAHADWAQGRRDEAKSRYEALLGPIRQGPHAVVNNSGARLNYVRLLIGGGERDAARDQLTRIAAAFATLGYPDSQEALEARGLLERLDAGG